MANVHNADQNVRKLNDGAVELRAVIIVLVAVPNVLKRRSAFIYTENLLIIELLLHYSNRI